MQSAEPYPNPAELLAHTSWMRALARSLVADPAAAEDLVQETWLAFMQHPPRHRGALRAWLARVLRNFAFRRRRSEIHQLRREERVARPEETAGAPDEIVARAEMHHRVVEMVLALKEPYRSTVLLHFFGELSPPDIARRQGIPVTTVRSRIARALADLRLGLDQAHGGERRAWSLAFLPLAGWTPRDLAEAAGACASVGSTAGSIALGGLSMTAKKTTVALVASLSILLGIIGLQLAFRGEPRRHETAAANTPERSPPPSTAPPSRVALDPAPVVVDPTAATAAPDAATGSPSLAGTVTSTDKRPVEGARVAVVEAQAWSAPLAGIEERYSGPHTGVPALHRTYTDLAAKATSTRTGADGAYAFHGLRAGQYRVLVSHRDHLAGAGSIVAVWEGETSRCDVALAAGVALDGHIVDEAGKAVAGARVSCEPSRSAGARGMAKALKLLSSFEEGGPLLAVDAAISLEDGRFSFHCLEPITYDIRAGKDGFIAGTLRSVEPGSRDVTLVLRRGAHVWGLVTAPDGSPLGGVEVQMHQSVKVANRRMDESADDGFDFLGEKTRRGTTAHDGRFRLDGVEAGNYELVARSAGFPRTRREVRVDREPVEVGEVRFQAPGSITGAVRFPPGAVPAAARVWARARATPGQEPREGEMEILAETRSSANGAFALDGLPPGPLDVLASLESGLRGIAQDIEAGREPVTIAIQAGRVITGSCVDRAGTPVGGASVGADGGAITVTGSDGAFELRNVSGASAAGDRVRLRATHPDFATVTESVPADGGQRVELRFTAAAGPRGIVLDQNRKPVARARVWAEIPGVATAFFAINPNFRGSVWSCHTDENGFFRLGVAQNPDLLAFPLEVLASQDGHGVGRVPVAAAGGEWNDVEILLAPSLTLEGRVAGASGAPVANARVEARRALNVSVTSRMRDIARFLPRPRGATTFTALDGSYRLPSLAPGRYHLEVAALGFAVEMISPVDLTGAGGRIDVTLRSGGHVSGRVLDETGQPLAGADVRALVEPESAAADTQELPPARERLELALGLGDGGVSAARTLGDGRYRLSRLPDGAVTLLAEAPGYQPALLEGARSGEEAADLVLVRNARLVGRAIDGATGRPLAAYQLRLEAREAGDASPRPLRGRVERAIDSPDGTFVWEDVAPGAYEVKVSSPERTPFRKRIVVLPGGETRLDARLDAGERLEGVVRVRATGAPVAAAVVELSPLVASPDPEEPARRGRGTVVKSGAGGEFAFLALEPGDYQLTVGHPDFYLDEEAERLVMALPRRELEPVDLNVQPAGRITGRVRFGHGSDPARDRYGLVLVRLETEAARARASDGERTGVVLADGSLQAAGIRPGRYRLEVHAAGVDPPAAAAVEEVEVRAGETASVDVEVP